MTLIEARDNDGLVGRCDERCYNASDPGCSCICQGANHGVGFHKALANTKAGVEQWRAAEIKRRGTRDLRFLSVPLNQFDLFPSSDV
jgi:hypothetical protein